MLYTKNKLLIIKLFNNLKNEISIKNLLNKK